MSIYCYIQNTFNILPSEILKDITTLEEFENYIKTTLRFENISLHCYYNYSTINLIDILQREEKINKNYLVTTEKDSNIIGLTSLQTLYKNYYMIPRLMTKDIFNKIFVREDDLILHIFNKNQILQSNDTFNDNLSYFYKIIN
jgi:hypothetical protein